MVLASTCVVAAAARGDPLVVGPLVPAPPVKDAAWWRFVCRLVQRNATHTALYVEKHAGRNYAHALYNTILYKAMFPTSLSVHNRGGLGRHRGGRFLRGARRRCIGVVALPVAVAIYSAPRRRRR